jgi:hypothetical protein
MAEREYLGGTPQPTAQDRDWAKGLAPILVDMVCKHDGSRGNRGTDRTRTLLRARDDAGPFLASPRTNFSLFNNELHDRFQIGAPASPGRSSHGALNEIDITAGQRNQLVH